MHNIRFIRENPTEFDNAMKLRGETPCSKKILIIDQDKRNTQTVLQNLLAERNILSKKIGSLKSNNKDISKILLEVEKIKEEILTLKELERIKDEELNAILTRLPNLASLSTPNGKNEKDNVFYRDNGNKPEFSFSPKRHFEIGEALNLMNFELASKISGTRFVVLKGMLSKLERAISQFMLDKHSYENGYTEMNVPYLVKKESLFGTGQLPKFSDDLFTAGEDHWLIPTAEVPLTNLVRNQILDKNNLPMRITSCTPCFRSEAGASGQDTKGMLRQHQSNEEFQQSLQALNNSISSFGNAVNAFQGLVNNPDASQEAAISYAMDAFPQIQSSILNNYSSVVSDYNPTIFDLSAINIYALGYNNSKHLVGNPHSVSLETTDNLPVTLTANIKNYLENFKIMTDTITINDGYIVNFGVFFDVIAEKHADKQRVKLDCIQRIKDYFRIEKMQFNQPIYKSQLEFELMGVEGVRSIGHITITQDNDYFIPNNAGENIVPPTFSYLFSAEGDGVDLDGDNVIDGGFITNGTTNYNFKYDFKTALSDDGTIIVPPNTSTPTVFELKNPNTKYTRKS